MSRVGCAGDHAGVVNPTDPSSHDPTLHCAGAGLGCTSRFSDRVLANRFIYHFTDPSERKRRLRDPQEGRTTARGRTFVKRIVGFPASLGANGFVFITESDCRAVRCPPVETKSH